MNINISVVIGLDFFLGHKKLLIKLTVELIKYKASSCTYKGRIRIGIFLVAYIHNRLAFAIYIIQHMYKILLVIAIIPVAFGHCRIYGL